MKNFSQIITEPVADKRSDTNEFVGVLLASAVLAWTVAPIIQGLGKGLGGFFDSIFGGDKKDDKGNDKKDDKGSSDSGGKSDGKGSSDSGSGNSGNGGNDSGNDGNNSGDSEAGKKDNEAFNSLLMMARQSNEKEKNANEKAKNDSMIKLLTACSFDKDGNEIPVEERINKMKDTMSPEQFEAFKKDMTETYEKNKDSQEFKDALVKAKANIKPEDYDKMLDEAKKEAKVTLEQLDKEKKEIDEYKQKLDDLEKQMKGEKDEDKLDELKAQQAQLQQNAPTSMVSSATGITASGEPASPTGEPAPQKSEEDINKEFDQKEADLEKEYKEKLDNEKDEDKKKEIQAELDKKKGDLKDEREKAVSAAKSGGSEPAAGEPDPKDPKGGGEPDPKDPKGGGEPDPKDPKGGGEPAKKPEDYKMDEIDAMQDELSNLDPEKDKDKIKEKEALLKSIAKAKGKNEDELIPKIEKDKEGRQVQRKTGPQGGKYYRVKTEDGWGVWQSDTNESISLTDYLVESTVVKVQRSAFNTLSEYLDRHVN